MKIKTLFTILVTLAIGLPLMAQAQVSSNFWKFISGILSPNVVGLQSFRLPYLASTGDPCVSVDTDGDFATTTCGGGSVDQSANYTWTGYHQFNSRLPESSINATTSNQFVNYSTLIANLQGLGKITNAVASSTANVDISQLNNGDVINGVTVATGENVLLKNQTAPAENGVYVVGLNAGDSARLSTMDSASEINNATVAVVTGTAGTLWYQNATVVTIDTDPVNFIELPPPPSYTFGDGLIATGIDIAVDLLTNSGLYFFGGQLGVSVNNTEIGTSTTNGALELKNLGITGAKIANGTITVSGATNKLTGVVGRANGGTGVSVSTDDTILVGNGTAWQAKALPPCSATNNALSYDATTNTVGCNTVTGGSGSGTAGGSEFTVSKVARKTADEIVNNSATFQNDDQLLFPVNANEAWEFRFVLYGNSATTPDFKFAVTGPTGSACTYGALDVEGAVATPRVTTCGVTTGAVVGTGAIDTYEVVGTVVTGSTGGNVVLQWAQNTANASDSTIYAGSHLYAFSTTTLTDSGFISTNASTSLRRIGEAVGIGTTSVQAKVSIQASSTLDKVLSMFDSSGSELFSFLRNGNAGIATTSPFAKLSVDGSVAFQGNSFATTTIGNKNAYLNISEGNFDGGLGEIRVPLIKANTLTGALGALNSLGIQNELILFENPLLNGYPALSFASSDFGDTGNSISLRFATNTPALNLDGDFEIENANDTPTLTFYTANKATSSSMFLTIDDSFFNTGATGGYYYDNSVAILTDDSNGNLVFGNTLGTVISAIGFDVILDKMRFIQASGGYEFLTIGATTTVIVGGIGSEGCLAIRDTDDGGFSYFYALDGVLIGSTNSCE